MDEEHRQRDRVFECPPVGSVVTFTRKWLPHVYVSVYWEITDMGYSGHPTLFLGESHVLIVMGHAPEKWCGATGKDSPIRVLFSDGRVGWVKAGCTRRIG